MFISNCVEYIYFNKNIAISQNNPDDKDLYYNNYEYNTSDDADKIIEELNKQIKNDRTLCKNISLFKSIFSYKPNKKDLLEQIYKNDINGSFKDSMINIISKGLYKSEICNLRFHYQGSKKINNDIYNDNDIVFRGVYYKYNNEFYKNEYKTVSMNLDYCDLIQNNYKKIINNTYQPNLLFIFLKSSLTNITDYKSFKKSVDVLYFFDSKSNIFLKEICEIFLENYEIYTNKYFNEQKSFNNLKLLILDYNIILFILRYSIYDFLRVLYNEYEGICLKINEKIIYVKLKNKEKKKILYNNI